MSLENYFSKIPDNMPRTRTKTIKSKPAQESTEQSEEANIMPAAEDEGANCCSSIDPNTLKALDKITDNITKVIDAKVDTVLAAIREQTTQIQALGARVGEAEGRIMSVEDATDSLQAKVTQLEKQVSGMLEHIDDLENRGRRCNVRLVGLPENAEGTDPVKFIETWLPSYLKITTKTGRIKLDRAHRSLAPKPDPKQRPRSIIMKFHNFSDKQRVMNAARRLGTEPDQPARNGPRISFFNDYSAAVVKKRKAFDEVKDRLKRINIDYALMYPATLKMTVNGVEKRFDAPEAAAAFLDSLG